MKGSSRFQAGFSIIEIMVALTLSLILTLGLVHIFTSNSQSFRLTEASSRLQETGRLSMAILGRAVRNADYWGCLKDVSGMVDNLNADANFDHNQFTRGLDAENDISDGTAVAGTDRLLLGGVNTKSAQPVAFQPSKQAANLQVKDNSIFHENDILMVSNCKDGDVFQVTNVNKANEVVVHNSGSVSDGPGNWRQSLSTNYNNDPQGATVYRPSHQRFYLRNRTNDDGSLTPELVTDGVNSSGSSGGVGLYSTPVALLEGVSDFQLQLGRDTTGNGVVDTWSDPKGLTAEGSSMASETLAVRMSILVRSQADNLFDGRQEYCFPGWLDCTADASLLTTAADRGLYRVYSNTAMIRNRMRRD